MAYFFFPKWTTSPLQLLGLQADVWSFGCTALESSTALPPWGKGAIDGMLSAVKRGSPRREPTGNPRGTHGCFNGGGESGRNHGIFIWSSSERMEDEWDYDLMDY